MINRRIGYLRVSTEEQRADRQIDGMTPLCDEIRIEKLSACARRRPIFEDVLAGLAPGDTLVVWDLDRAFRSTLDALNTLETLKAREIDFRIVNLGLDTATPYGKLIYVIISGLAEFERALLSERTKQGLAAARRRGKRLGRPPKMTDDQVREAKAKLTAGSETVTALAARYNVHPWTLTRSLRRLEVTENT